MPRRPLDILNCFVVATLLLLAVICHAMGRLHAAPALPLRCAALLAGVLLISALERHFERFDGLDGFDRLTPGKPTPGKPTPGKLRAGGPSFLARRRWLATAVNLLVDFYPMALIPLVYDALGFLIPALNPVEKDRWLIAADRAIFGLDPTVWLQRFIWAPLTDVLYLAYSMFFFIPLIVGIPLWRRSPVLGRRFLFMVSVAFYVSYTGYALVPAEGPRVGLAAEQTVRLQQTTLSKDIAGTLNELERNRVDAFPSGHILITSVCLITAARYFRRLFWCLLPVALLLMLATVYCRYHYVIDVIAAFALTPVIPVLADWLYDRLSGEKPWSGKPVAAGTAGEAHSTKA
jgi:membrane-associated phospholipid phosphatase